MKFFQILTLKYINKQTTNKQTGENKMTKLNNTKLSIKFKRLIKKSKAINVTVKERAADARFDLIQAYNNDNVEAFKWGYNTFDDLSEYFSLLIF